MPGVGGETPEAAFAVLNMAQSVMKATHRLAPEGTWPRTYCTHKNFEQILHERSSYF